MRRILRSKNTGSLLAVFVLLLVSFQNCSQSSAPVNFQYKTNADLASDSSGNGGTYDGKPTGTYIRRSASACDSASNWIGVLNLGESSAELTNDLCVALNYVLELVDTRLEFSAFNPDYVGLNAAIFERSETSTPALNAPVVDLWCHYQDAEFGLDVVVRTDSANSSESIVYVGESLSSSSPRVRKFNSLPTVKSSSAGRLTAATVDGAVSTEVDVSNPDAIKHPGRAVVRLDGKSLDLSVSCRVVSSKPAVVVKPTNALAIYQMNEPVGAASDGSLIADSSNNNRNVGLNNSDGLNAAFVNGLIGNALSFDGVDANVDLSMLSPQTASGFTFSAWVLPSTQISDKAVLFGVFDPTLAPPSYSNTLRIGFGFCNPSPDPTADKFELTIDGRNGCITTGISIVDGQWHMVTLSVQGSQALLYLDGVQVSSYVINTARIPASDVWALGQDWDSATNENDRYLGLMDEVTVWNLPLSAAEIDEAFKKSGN